MNIELHYGGRQYGLTTSIIQEIKRSYNEDKKICVVLHKNSAKFSYREISDWKNVTIISESSFDIRSKQYNVIYFDCASIKLNELEFYSVLGNTKIKIYQTGLVDSFIFNYLFALMNDIKVTIYRRDVVEINHNSTLVFDSEIQNNIDLNLSKIVTSNNMSDATRRIFLEYLLKSLKDKHNLLLDNNLFIVKRKNED